MTLWSYVYVCALLCGYAGAICVKPELAAASSYMSVCAPLDVNFTYGEHTTSISTLQQCCLKNVATLEFNTTHFLQTEADHQQILGLNRLANSLESLNMTIQDVRSS